MEIEPGRVLTHYRLIAKLGEGGMGVVWKALDTNLDREVAVKFLPAAFSTDPARLERFAREAKLLASINHPNVATVYGLHFEAGTSFLAMELVPGRDLAHALREKPMGVAEALAVARQIAAALEATHQRGVVHRDLKPANVFLTPGGEVRVLDFGIARDLDPEADAEPPAALHTQPDTILGTVSYMSPEQARGKPLDTRTDLWSFGCVLYEMLCGRPAFGGETRWDKLAAVLREEPQWNALPADTPDAIRELLQRCLEKDAERRLSEASEARRVIEATLATFTAPEGLPALTGPRRPAPARRRFLPAAVVVLAALVVTAVGYWSWRGSDGTDATGAGPVPNPRSVAVLPFESMGGGEENRIFAAGMHDDILNNVAKISEIKVISRTSVMEYRDSPKSLRQIGSELGVATVLEGTVHRSGNQVRVNVQLIDAASERNLWAESYDREFTPDGIFSIQSAIAEQIAIALRATLSADEKRRIDVAPTTDMQAYDAYLRGLEFLNRPGMIGEDLVAARRMFERAIERDPGFALAYAGLSGAARNHYWMGGGTDEALGAARAAADRALQLAPDLAEAHLAKGSCLYVLRDYDAALEELRIAERGLPGDAELMRWKAYIVRRRGRWPEALQDLTRALALDPRDAETANEVGFTLLCTRRYDEALRYFDAALALAPDYPAPRIYRTLIPVWRDGTHEAALAAAPQIEATTHNPWSYAHGWHALLYTRDYERALTFLSGRPRIAAQWYSYPPELLQGWTRRLQGRDDEAARGFEAAAAALEADLRSHPDDARVHGALGVAYAGLGRKADALREGRKALELLPIEKDAFVGAWQTQDLAWTYAMTGEPDAAIEALERVLAVPSTFSIEALLLDPRADPLREHPAFRALAEKFRRKG